MLCPHSFVSPKVGSTSSYARPSVRSWCFSQLMVLLRAQSISSSMAHQCCLAPGGKGRIQYHGSQRTVTFFVAFHPCWRLRRFARPPTSLPRVSNTPCGGVRLPSGCTSKTCHARREKRTEQSSTSTSTVSTSSRLQPRRECWRALFHFND